MHPTDADLSPDPFDKLTAGERRREIAAIFAAGILRLSTCPGIAPEPTSPGADDAPANSPDSAQKPLDSGGASSPHVPAG